MYAQHAWPAMHAEPPAQVGPSAMMHRPSMPLPPELAELEELDELDAPELDDELAPEDEPPSPAGPSPLPSGVAAASGEPGELGPRHSPPSQVTRASTHLPLAQVESASHGTSTQSGSNDTGMVIVSCSTNEKARRATMQPL